MPKSSEFTERKKCWISLVSNKSVYLAIIPNFLILQIFKCAGSYSIRKYSSFFVVAIFGNLTNRWIMDIYGKKIIKRTLPPLDNMFPCFFFFQQNCKFVICFNKICDMYKALIVILVYILLRLELIFIAKRLKYVNPESQKRSWLRIRIKMK